MWSEARDGKTRYIERYTDFVTGKQRRVSVTLKGKDTPQNRRIASDLLRLKIAKQPMQSETLGALYDSYIAYQAETVKASTIHRNKRTLSKMVELLGKDANLERLTVGYVINKLMSMDCSNITRNDYIKRTKAMFNYGLTMGIHNNHALTTIPYLPTPTTQKERIADKYLEPEEATKLLDYFAEHNLWRWYHMTKIMLLSGLRSGELIALNDEDVGEKYIEVNKTFDIINKVTTSTKTTTSTRQVFIQKELAEEIRIYRMWRREENFKNGISTPLFVSNRDGKHICYYYFNRMLREVSKSILGRVVTTHTLRHTHASLLLANGISIDEISRRLGHANSEVTREVYLHVTEKLKEKDNEKLADLKII